MVYKLTNMYTMALGLSMWKNIFLEFPLFTKCKTISPSIPKRYAKCHYVKMCTYIYHLYIIVLTISGYDILKPLDTYFMPLQVMCVTSEHCKRKECKSAQECYARTHVTL